jgi:hypothetical protein
MPAASHESLSLSYSQLGISSGDACDHGTFGSSPSLGRVVLDALVVSVAIRTVFLMARCALSSPSFVLTTRKKVDVSTHCPSLDLLM